MTRTISSVLVPSNAPAQLLASNADRQAAYLYVEDGSLIYLGDDDSVTVDTGWPYQNGSAISLALTAIGELWAIVPNDPKDVRVTDVLA